MISKTRVRGRAGMIREDREMCILFMPSVICDTIYSAFFLFFLSPSPSATQRPQNSKNEAEIDIVEV
jgi:hypothetical protein